jgi:Zn-dependent protease
VKRRGGHGGVLALSVLQSFGLSSLESLLPAAVILVLSLSFHEAAHAWTADRLGDPTARMLGRLTLNPLSHIDWIGTVLFPLLALYSGLPIIGWAKPVPVNMMNLRHPRRDFAVVAVAGPISNLILAVAGAAVLMVIPGGATALASGSSVASFLVMAVVVNVLLAVFNMIPVPPLDGGNVLAGLVPEEMARVVDQLRPYGFLVLYALMLTGVLSAITWPIQRAILGWLL